MVFTILLKPKTNLTLIIFGWSIQHLEIKCEWDSYNLLNLKWILINKNNNVFFLKCNKKNNVENKKVL